LEWWVGVWEIPKVVHFLGVHSGVVGVLVETL